MTFFPRILYIYVEEYVNHEYILSLETKEDLPETTNLGLHAKYIMEIIDSVFRNFDCYVWKAPIILEETATIILRMENSEFDSVPAHFYMLGGIIEEVMNQYIEVSVSVHQVLRKENIVDLKFHFSS